MVSDLRRCFIYFISVYMCVLAFLCAVYVQCLQKPQEGVRSLGARVRACEWSDVGAGMQTMSTAMAARALKC